MPRFKDVNHDQVKMIPIAFYRQILPNSIEIILLKLIDNERDLSGFYRMPRRPAFYRW